MATRTIYDLLRDIASWPKLAERGDDPGEETLATMDRWIDEARKACDEREITYTKHAPPADDFEPGDRVLVVEDPEAWGTVHSIKDGTVLVEMDDNVGTLETYGPAEIAHV